MTHTIRIKRGLNIPVSGRPVQTVREGPVIGQVALCGPDYVGLKPRMLVSEGDSVRAGQPLFVHKHHPEIPYCSPGTGQIVAINRGPRRALHSVVVQLAGEETGAELFEPMGRNRVQRLGRSGIADRLRATGLWTAFRKRPFNHVPEPGAVPRSIFVTAIDTHPLGGDPAVIIGEQADAFEDGLRVLPMLTDGPVFLCTSTAWDLPVPETDRLRHVAFSGPHPAGLPGTHIHYLDPVGAGREVWHIGYQDVIAMGRLFREGLLDFSRTVALGGTCISEPRLVRTRLGASTDELLSTCKDDIETCRTISGSVLGGRTATGGLAYLGRYHNQVCAIPEGGDRHLFGWTGVFPWRYSAARTFLRQAGHRRRHNITTAQNGRFTGMIPTRAFERVMPLDILPSPLLRALLVRDTDQAQALGCLELDEEDLALCSFVCPAKIDYGTALRVNLQQIEKEG